jgi:fibronectin type 3 domain-containing protein
MLGCGSSVIVDNTTGPSEIDSYSCVPSWQETGPEDAYWFYPEASGPVTLHLGNFTGDPDVFLLGNSGGVCHEDQCLEYGHNQLTYVQVNAGETYYVVVDSYEPDVGQATLTVSCIGPMPPTNVQASDGTYRAKIEITWDASTGAEYYELHKCDEDDCREWVTVLGGPVVVNDYDPDAGEVQTYAAKACTHVYGCSSLSEPDTGYKCVPPQPPTDLEASDGTYADKVRVTWQYPVTYYERFELVRGTSWEEGGTDLLYQGLEKTYDDTSAIPGTTYYYWVSVCDPCCSYSSSHDTGYRCVPLQPPDHVQASDGTYDDKVRITWQFPPTSHEYHFELYRVPWDGGSETLLYEGLNKSYDDTSATPGSTYIYFVKACDTCGCSKPSLSDTGYQRCDPPAPPANVQATDDEYDDRVRVTWDSVPGADEYEVYRAESASGSKAELATTGSTAYSDRTATPGTNYYYWVKACSDDCGCGDFSSPDTGSRSGTCPELPTPPGNVQASDGAYTDKVRVQWDTVSGAEEYEVYRADSATGDKSRLASQMSTSYDDTTAAPGTTYHYWVTTCTAACGCSPYSDADTGYRSSTCADPPHVPSNPSPTDGASEVSTNAVLSWTGGHPCAGETATYDVYLESGDDTPDELVCDDAPSWSCVPSSLQGATSYYWKVTANGRNGPVSGPVWGFSTTSSDMNHWLYLPLLVR